MIANAVVLACAVIRSYIFVCKAVIMLPATWTLYHHMWHKYSDINMMATTQDLIKDNINIIGM